MSKPFLSPEMERAEKVAIKKGYFVIGKDDINFWRKTFVARFLEKYPGSCVTIDVFTKVLGHVPTWKDITDRNLRDLRDALHVGRCASSVKTMCGQVKAVINANAFLVHLGKDPMELCDTNKALSVRKNPSQAVYLTRMELERLNRVKPMTPIERHVKRVFMVEALTGARHIDAQRINAKHINAEGTFLTYRAEKTEKPVTVPVHKWLRSYLNIEEETPVTRLCTFNDVLRSLCYRAGIRENVTLTRRGKEQQAPKWQFISSHTGRRTFATLLYLHGTDVATIAQLMGHSSPMVTFNNYICAQREIDENTVRYFNNF